MTNPKHTSSDLVEWCSQDLPCARYQALEAENEQWKVDCNELLLEVAKLRSALKNHSYTGKGWRSFKETYEALEARHD